MIDYTARIYEVLLSTLSNQDFSFYTISEFLLGTTGKTILFRHDVDKQPLNSLEFARIQTEAMIRGTFYFRAIPESWDEEVISKITGMGHEVGYHYEDISLAWSKLKASGVRRNESGEELEKGLVEAAMDSFLKNLEKLRKITPVRTICMHGSPMCRWDNRLLWKYYDYHEFGISGEPYFDIDFDNLLYLTDTGRRWDGGGVSIRDKASGVGRQASGENPYKDWKVKPFNYREPLSPSPPLALSPSFYKLQSTFDIIRASEEGRLPEKIMMTFHPQRWTDKPIPWFKELIWQSTKNIIKYFVVKVNLLN